MTPERRQRIEWEGEKSEGDGDLGEKSRGGKWMNMGRGKCFFQLVSNKVSSIH